MTLFFAVVIALAASILLIGAGYLSGVRSGNEARAALREAHAASAREVVQLQGRLAHQTSDDEGLRTAIRNILTPLVQRDQLSFDLAQLQGGGSSRDLSALLDRAADMGNLSAALLCDARGFPLATSTHASNADKLGATAALLLLLADRLTRDGSPAPLSLMIHDAANQVTLCRLFEVGNQRLALTATSLGSSQLSATTLDPLLIKLKTMLLDPERGESARARAAPG